MELRELREQIEKEIREEIKAKQREYKKEWRAKNPDKVRKHNENYILRKAVAIAAEREEEYNG